MSVAAPSRTPAAAAVLPSWLGCRAYDAEGGRLGHVADVLFDERTHAPAWVVLVVARGEDRLVLVPAVGMRHSCGGIGLPVSREAVRTAPVAVGVPGELGSDHAAALSRHFGVRPTPGPWRGVVEPDVMREDRVRL